jgi:hypothetical protein
MQNPFRALQRVLVQRRALATREMQLLDRLVKDIASARSVPASGNGNGKRLRRSLRCDRCDRRFALPMHLGRHMAMSHRRRKAA